MTTQIPFIREKLYIDGRWQASANGNTIRIINPATEQEIGHVPSGGSEDVNRAVKAAQTAFTGDWRKSSGRERAQYLNKIADLIEEELDHLAYLEVQDNGKPLDEAKWDIEDTVGCFRYYAGLATKLDCDLISEIKLSDERFQSQARQEAIGVVGLIVPWNYPLLMAAWKVAPALAAGCTMVLKPSELTSMTALELGRIVDQAGLPAGVLNIVTGTGAEAGAALSGHPGLQKIAFTGSVATGRQVMKAAAENITPVSLELGGKSPIIIFDDVDLDAAVEWIMFGIFWNKGEVCSATSRLLVQEDLHAPLMQRLKDAAEHIQIGNGMTEGVKLGPLVNDGQYLKVMEFIERAKGAGIELVSGGHRPKEMDKGYFLTPTIFDNVPQDSELWREEIFGPVLAVRSFSDEADALQQANDNVYGLAAAVLTLDEARAERMAQGLNAGIIWLNCSQPTFCEAPWGGKGLSGIGRELGPWGLNNYLDTKQVTSFRAGETWGWYGIG